MSDKNLLEMVIPLRDLVNHWYPTIIAGKRAASMELISSIFSSVLPDKQITCFPDLINAYETAVSNYSAGDLIVVYGSFLIVGVVLANLLSYTNKNSSCYKELEKQ